MKSLKLFFFTECKEWNFIKNFLIPLIYFLIYPSFIVYIKNDMKAICLNTFILILIC